jgi:hypothetical protein
VPTEPWRLEPEWRSERAAEERPPTAAAHGDRGGRRTIGSEYLIDAGVQEDFWAGDPGPTPTPPDEGIAGRRRAGRHAAPEPGEDVPSTVPLRTLLGELDARRPGGRHHR